jgi:hypothetical protein
MQTSTAQATLFDAAETASAAKAAPGSPAATEARVELVGRARTVFEAMRAIVEAPGSILKHYKQDFYKYDARYLARTHALGLHVWILRDSGTHLVRIGVHERMNLELDAALHAGREECEIYLIDPERVSIKPITEARVRDLMKSFEYQTNNGNVTKAGQCIAWLDVRITPWSDGKPPQGIVKIETMSQRLSKGDLIALRQIAECEVIAATQSLFTGTKECTIRGEDVFDLIARAA